MATKLDTATATTLESQAAQILYHMNNLENANVDADGAVVTDNVQIAPDEETGLTVFTLTLQMGNEISANGILTTPATFLVDPST